MYLASLCSGKRLGLAVLLLYFTLSCVSSVSANTSFKICIYFVQPSQLWLSSWSSFLTACLVFSFDCFHDQPDCDEHGRIEMILL